MFKKDYLYAGVIGFITAFFLMLILTNTQTALGYGSVALPLWSLFLILPIGEYIGYLIASKLFSHILVLKQLGRFGIVGLMNFSVDVGVVLTLRVWTGIDVESPWMLLLFVAGATVAIINSYFWQRAWTFSEKAPPSGSEFLKFVLVTVIGIGVNSLVAYVAIITLSAVALPGLMDDRLVVVSKVLATVVSLFWNFFGYKFIVFKGHAQIEPQTQL